MLHNGWRRRAAGVLTAVAMAAAGCGPAASTAAKGSTASAAPVTLTWLVRSDMGANITKWENDVVTGFEKANPNVHITVIGEPWAGYNAKLLALTAAGTPPDVYATFAAGFGTFLAHGTLADLNSYAKGANLNLKEFQSSAIAALTRNGRLYGLPFDNMPSLIFYNKTLFDQAHLPLPPTSWQDKNWTTSIMLADAKALTKNTTQPGKAVWGLNFPPGQMGTAVSWVWGCDPTAASGGPQNSQAYLTGVMSASQLFFNSPCYTAAMRWDKDLSVTEGVSPSVASLTTLSQLGDPITTGRIGMEQAGYWVFQNLFLAKPKFQWGVAPIPYGPTGSDLTQDWTDAWVMSSKSTHKSLAFKFMVYMSTGASAKEFAQITGFFPALTSLEQTTLQADAAALGMSENLSQLQSVILGGLAKGQGFEAPGHTLANWNQINTTWANTTDNLFIGKQTTGAAMAALNQAMATQLQSNAG